MHGINSQCDLCGRIKRMLIASYITIENKYRSTRKTGGVSFSGKALNVIGYVQLHLVLACRPCNCYVPPQKRDQIKASICVRGGGTATPWRRGCKKIIAEKTIPHRYAEPPLHKGALSQRHSAYRQQTYHQDRQVISSTKCISSAWRISIVRDEFQTQGAFSPFWSCDNHVVFAIQQGTPFGKSLWCAFFSSFWYGSFWAVGRFIMSYWTAHGELQQ